jgi:hypothetical protein
LIQVGPFATLASHLTRSPYKKLSSIAFAGMFAFMLPSIATAQLANGSYTLTDLLNGVNGNATAATLPGSGTGL